MQCNKQQQTNSSSSISNTVISFLTTNWTATEIKFHTHWNKNSDTMEDRPCIRGKNHTDLFHKSCFVINDSNKISQKTEGLPFILMWKRNVSCVLFINHFDIEAWLYSLLVLHILGDCSLHALPSSVVGVLPRKWFILAAQITTILDCFWSISRDRRGAFASLLHQHPFVETQTLGGNVRHIDDTWW